jgi:aryl-alcohol dehydrogenase-like predicted oxidoreductase
MFPRRSFSLFAQRRVSRPVADGLRPGGSVEIAHIGTSGIETSRIGLGTWAIGGWLWGGQDDSASVATIREAVDRGISLIDTAPVYGFGRSEEVVGRAIAEGGLRDRVVLATKAALEWSDDETIWRNASASRIHEEIDASLRRLRTDHVDVYQVHWPDPETPIEETARAMEDLFRAGKIRAVGVSNFSPEEMKAFREAAPLHACQPPYNLSERGVEDDVLPACRRLGVSTLCYGALCRGLLSGAMSRERTFTGDDLRQMDPKFRGERFDQYLAAVRALEDLARERFGKSVLELALRWLLDRPGVTVALWGARRPDQLDPVEGVLGWSLDDEAMRAVDEILAETIRDPVGPEFMAPPPRSQV